MVELKFLIAFFLAFTAGILAIKLGQEKQKKSVIQNYF